jgi:hypothetical protein
MKILHVIRFLIPLLSLTAVANAGDTILFEDTFGQTLPRNSLSRGDFNVGTDSRQSGPLAPVNYTHNGESWQAQTQFNPVEGVVCRLFPKQPWLAASPEWELDSSDGTYEMVLEFSLPNEFSPHQNAENKPGAPVAEALLLIGQSVPEGAEELRLNQGFAVNYRANPDQPSLFWVYGQNVGEFEPTREGETQHTIKIRWTQKDRVVSDIEAELNGEIVKDQGGFSLEDPKVQFGGRGRLRTDYDVAGINCVNILQLTYSKK